MAAHSHQPVLVEADATTCNHIRRSGLLVGGRFLSSGLTLLTQIVIVRYLATNDYGAWAYALSVVVLWQGLCNIGFHEAVSRFVPLYHQRGEYTKMLGTMLLAAVLVLGSGILVVAAFHLGATRFIQVAEERALAIQLLKVLIVMVPLEAVDAVLNGVFASFAKARAIFFRRHLLGPGLRLAVVALLVVSDASVLFLAYGYVVASAVGVLLYAGVLIRRLHRDGLLSHCRWRGIEFPCRELFGFTVPLMTTDLLVAVNHSVAILLLGYFYSMGDVAFFRVVLPVATMIEMVSLAASLLYLPAAARLYAAGNKAGVAHLYWRTAAWMAVTSLPLFTLTFCFARPVTVLFFGARYADADTLLAILSIGYFFNVVFGFNGATLKAANKVRYVVGYNLITAITSVTLALLLIRPLGAIGAAVATSLTIMGYAFLKQIALWHATSISIFDRRCTSFYALIGLAVACLVAVRWVAELNLYAGIVLACCCLVAVVLVARKELDIVHVFPESTRIPLMRRFVA